MYFGNMQNLCMSKPSVPLARVERTLQKEWGSFSDLQALAGGLTSQVFSFRSGDAEYVIRISDSPYSFQKDAFVSHRFASPSLPIPKVVKLGQLGTKTHFCISHRAPGVPLQALTTSEFVGVTDCCYKRYEHDEQSRPCRHTGIWTL